MHIVLIAPPPHLSICFLLTHLFGAIFAWITPAATLPYFTSYFAIAAGKEAKKIILGHKMLKDIT